MAISADFGLLANNLMGWDEAQEVRPPDPPVYKVFPRIQGLNIPVDWETCCIEMSFAMNMGGLRLVSGDLQDANGFYYYQRVPEVRDYLNRTYEAAQNYARADATGALILGKMQTASSGHKLH